MTPPPAYTAYLDGHQVPSDGYRFVLDVTPEGSTKVRELFVPETASVVRYQRKLSDPVTRRSAIARSYDPQRVAANIEAVLDRRQRLELACSPIAASALLKKLWRAEKSAVQAVPVVIQPSLIKSRCRRQPQQEDTSMPRKPKSVSIQPVAEKKGRGQLAKATKPVKSVPAPAEKKTRSGVGTFIQEQILANVSREKLAAEIQKRFPESKAADPELTMAHVSWYAGKLRRDGVTTPSNYAGRAPKAAA